MKTPQFSLRSLLAFTAIAGLLAAVCRWLHGEPEWIVAYGLLIGGVAVFGKGLISRSRPALIAGRVLFLISLGCMALSTTSRTGGGSVQFHRAFSVYDAVSKQPIDDAIAWLYDSETSERTADAQAHSNGLRSVDVAYSYSVHNSAFASRKQFYVKYDKLHVTAPGYKAFDASVIEFFKVESKRGLRSPANKVYLEPLDRERSRR